MNRMLVISSMVYKFSERFLVKIFGLVIAVVLARYIAPQDFGYLAILMVFEFFAEVFVNSGMPTALVQKRDIVEQDYSTAFYVGLGMAGIFVLCLFFAAPWISHYYGTDDLIWPLRIYSLVLLISAFNGIKFARLQRKMRFRVQLICYTIAVLASGVLGVYLAMRGLGLWALVSYVMSQAVFLMILLFVVDGWYPKLNFDWNRAMILFSFGSRILGVNLLNNLYNNCRSLIIGKQFNVTELAYYDRGKWISEVVSSNYDNAIQSVILPTLAREQDNQERAFAIVRRSVGIGILVLIPVLFGLVVLAKPLIVLLITERWLFAVPYMQVLTLAFLTIPVVSTLMTAVVALGYSSADLRIEVYRKAVQIGILIYSVVAYDSVMAIAQWFVIGNFIDLFLVVCLTKKYVGYSLQHLFVDSWKVLIASVIMGGVVYQVSLFGWSNLLTVVGGFVVGVVVYGLLCWLLRVEAFMYVIGILRNKFMY